MQRKPGGIKKQQKPRTKKEHSAGGVVFQDSPQGPLIGLILNSYYKWTFPKGHIEKGETAEVAAVHESEEEMGLRHLRLVAPLGSIKIIFLERFRHGKPVKGSRTRIEKTIDYFLIKAPRGSRGSVPELGDGEPIRGIKWVPMKQIRRAVEYKNVQSILERAIVHIKKQQKQRKS